MAESEYSKMQAKIARKNGEKARVRPEDKQPEPIKSETRKRH